MLLIIHFCYLFNTLKVDIDTYFNEFPLIRGVNQVGFGNGKNTICGDSSTPCAKLNVSFP